MPLSYGGERVGTKEGTGKESEEEGRKGVEGRKGREIREGKLRTHRNFRKSAPMVYYYYYYYYYTHLYCRMERKRQTDQAVDLRTDVCTQDCIAVIFTINTRLPTTKFALMSHTPRRPLAPVYINCCAFCISVLPLNTI